MSRPGFPVSFVGRHGRRRPSPDRLGVVGLDPSPGASTLGVVLSVNLVGDAVRDLLDPRLWRL
jgi:hypothetical protein